MELKPIRFVLVSFVAHLWGIRSKLEVCTFVLEPFQPLALLIRSLNFLLSTSSDCLVVAVLGFANKKKKGKRGADPSLRTQHVLSKHDCRLLFAIVKFEIRS